MEWFRWFEGSTTDPKFAVVARRTGQPVAFVIAVWAQILERASASKERGCIDGYDCEGADVSLGLPDGAACAIVQALKDKGLIDEYRVCKWEQRQPKRERDPEPSGSSTGRVKDHRARKQKETDGNGPQRDETPCNAMKRPVTTRNNLEEIREEEKKEERKTDASHLAQSDAGVSLAQPPAEQERPVAFIPLADGSEYPVPVSLACEYATAYPGVNVMGEFGKARAWCLSNPRQRKTKNGIRRFLNGWMDKAQNNASRSSPAVGSGRPMTARQVEAAERGDFAEQVLKLDEVYRNGELAAFGSGTQQGVCALSAAEARAGGIRVAGQDLGRRAG